MYKGYLYQFTSVYTGGCVICTMVSCVPNFCTISVEHKCVKVVQDNDKKIMSKFHSKFKLN